VFGDYNENNTRLMAIFQDNPSKPVQYQNVSILDFLDPRIAKDNGSDGDIWSYETCRIVISSPHFYKLR